MSPKVHLSCSFSESNHALWKIIVLNRDVNINFYNKNIMFLKFKKDKVKYNCPRILLVMHSIMTLVWIEI